MKRFLLTLIVASVGLTSCKDASPQWKQVDPKDIKENSVSLFADKWAIVTAGTPDNFNMMTISWGTLGHLWNKPVAFCFIRPQRYTYEFTERETTFTISFFDESYRDVLSYIGSHSGRNEDKVKASGLTPKVLSSGNITFEEARMVIECKKTYADFFREENFIDADVIGESYPQFDFHKMYVGEITNVWKK